MSDRDTFIVQGGCWCPDDATLRSLRTGGHTIDCIAARKGWAANMRHLSALDRERREMEAIGRAVVEAARA